MCIRNFLLLLFFSLSLQAFSQTANFSITKKEGCAPLDAVNFTDISTGGTVVNRKWNLGQGPVIDKGDQTVGLTYKLAGTYIITLTVTFSTGQVASKQDTVVVHPNPVAAFTTNDTAGCASHNAQFKDLSNTPTGTNVKWEWNIGPGTSGVQNPTYSFNNNGNYGVSLLVTNNWGCKSNLAEKQNYIHVYDKVKASFSIPENYSCDTPFAVKFVNRSTGGGIISYSWLFGDGDSSKEINPVHSYAHPGVYQVQLTAKNGSKCTDTYAANNKVFVGKTSALIKAADSTCANTSVLFSGSVSLTSFSNFVTWKWIFPAGATSSSQNSSYTFSTPGTYDILLISYYNSNCPDTAHHSIVVKPGPKPEFTADKTTACNTPFAVNFSNLSEPARGLTYTWNFGDGFSSNLPKPSHSYTGSGSFTVTLTIRDTTVSNGCTTVMQKVNFIRIAKPVVDFTYIPPAGCTPLPVVTTARVTNVIDPVVNYIWNFGTGTLVTTSTINATHTYNAAGTYNIKLTIVTQQGCTDSSKAKVVSVVNLCSDDGGGGGGGSGGGGGFTIKKTCADKYTISFTDTVSNSTIISWDFGDGSPFYTTSPLNNIAHTFPNNSKNYIVTVTRKDTLTNIIYTSQKRVIIIDEKANFSPNIINICKDKRVDFKTTDIDSSNIDTYTWDFGDNSPRVTINSKRYYQAYGVYLNGNTFYTFKEAGEYYVKLFIKDKLGCIDSFMYATPVVVKGPVAGFKASLKTSCDKNFTVDFTDTSKSNGTVPIQEWSWNMGNGVQKLISVPDSVIRQAYVNGSYYQEFNVVLTVKDSLGCQNASSQIIKSYNPKANFSSSDTLKCGKLDVTLFTNSSAYVPVYTWYYGDGTFSTAGSHTYQKEGIYDIKLVVVDQNGCRDSMTKKSFIKLVKPKADFRITDTSKCGPTSVNFFDSSLYATKYKWSFGDKSAAPVVKDISHLYNPGNYNVKLVIEGISGCVDSITRTVRIKGPVGKLFTSSNVGCAPYRFSMNVKGNNISAYAWDYGDGTPVSPSTDSMVTHIFHSGKVLPNVVMISPEGCRFLLNADTVTVDSVKAAFKMDKNDFCDTGYVQFQNNSYSGTFSSLKNYKWNLGDNFEDISPVPSLHAYNNPGSYKVSLAIESSLGCKDTAVVDRAVIIRKSPLATISGDSVVCLAPASLLQLNSSIKTDEPVSTYSWKIDNLAMSSDSNAVINYRIPGQHVVRLNVKTNTGCEATVDKNIVIDSVKALFDINLNTFCGAGTAIFNNRSLNVYPVQYQWQFGDDSISNKANPSHAYTLPGQYQVKLLMKSNVGCKDSFSLQQPISIYKLPMVSIAGESEKCAETLMHYGAMVSSTDSISGYLWKLDNNTVSKSNSLDYSFTKAGSYNLAVTVNTQYGCEATVAKNIIIHPLPVPQVSEDTAICIGQSVRLHTTGGVSYNWSPLNSLQNANTADPVTAPIKSTTYYVTVTNSLGCTQKDSVHIVVDNKVSLQHSNDASICVGEAIHLMATGNTQHFSWGPSAGLSNPNIAKPVASPIQTTVYKVIGYSDNACPNDTGFVKIIVGNFPTVNLGPDLTVDAGSTINLKALVSNDVVKYHWKPSVGLNCSNCSSPQLIADKDITYKLTVSTEYGCKTSDDINIRVLCGKGAVYIPNAFTPNGDGLNDVFYVRGYGIQRIKSFNIYDRWGKAVYSRENIVPNDRNNGWNGLVNDQPLSGTATFVYLVEVICNEGKTFVMKGTVVLIR